MINFMSGTGLPIEIKNTTWKKAQNVPHLTNKPVLRLEFKQQVGFTSLQLYDRSHKNVTSLVMCIKTLTASERKQLAEHKKRHRTAHGHLGYLQWSNAQKLL